MPGAVYPQATPAAMAYLVWLLESRGVELRVSPGGELRLRDRDKRLSSRDRAAVHHYRHDLADWLAGPSVADAPGSPDEPAATGPRCDRCGAAEFVEVSTHGGASVRRDCGRCGRTWGFPVWRGVAG